MPGVVSGQAGGSGIYRFLELPWYPRAAALGGTVVSLPDTSVELGFSNPALLNPAISGQVSLNYSTYFAGISFGSVAGSFSLPLRTTAMAGVTFIRYGEFLAADETGNITGTFRAAEYSIPLSVSYPIDSFFTAGITLRPVFSVLEQYRSTGLTFDAGIGWHSRAGLTTAALLIRNSGFEISSYTAGNGEPPPLEILAGLSHKLRHAPFRLVLTVRNIQQPRLYYKTGINPPGEYDPGTAYQEGPATNAGWFTENLFRHLITGIEFLPVENLAISVGYNYQRRKELQISSRPGMIGFSWGFRLRISGFNVSYSRAAYHLSGATNQFSVGTNLTRFLHPGILK